MKIRYKRWCNREPTEEPVAKVAECCMEDKCYDESGQIESLSSSLSSTREFVAKLIEILAEKGMLTKAELAELLASELGYDEDIDLVREEE